MEKTLIAIMLLTALPLHAQRTHGLVLVEDRFEPEILVMEAGDRIDLVLSGAPGFVEVNAAEVHTGAEVLAEGIEVVGGIGAGSADTDALGTILVLNDPGTRYFKSDAPAGGQATVKVIVLPGNDTGVGASVNSLQPKPFPNPADDQVRFAGQFDRPFMVVEVFDSSGRRVMQTTVRSDEPMNVSSLQTGHYTLRLSDGLSTVYGVERLVIDRKGES